MASDKGGSQLPSAIVMSYDKFNIFFCFVLKKGLYYVAQASTVPTILLSQPFKYWDSRYTSPC